MAINTATPDESDDFTGEVEHGLAAAQGRQAALERPVRRGEGQELERRFTVVSVIDENLTSQLFLWGVSGLLASSLLRSASFLIRPSMPPLLISVEKVPR